MYHQHRKGEKHLKLEAINYSVKKTQVQTDHEIKVFFDFLFYFRKKLEKLFEVLTYLNMYSKFHYNQKGEKHLKLVAKITP